MAQDLSILLGVKLDTSKTAIDSLNKQIKSIKLDAVNVKINIDTKSIDNLKKQIKDLNNSVGKNLGSTGSKKSIVDFGTPNKSEIESFIKTLKSSGTVVDYTYDKFGKLGINLKNTTSELVNLQYQFDKTINSFKNLNEKTKVPDLLINTNKLAQQLPEIRAVYKQFNNLKKESSDTNIDFNTSKLIPNLELLNSKTKILNTGMQQVSQTFRLNGQQTLTVSGQYNMLTKELTNVSTATGNLINRQLGLAGALQNAFTKFPIWIGVSTVVMGFFHSVQAGVAYINELDNALNEVRIVTNKTQFEVDKLGKSYNNLAKEMSVTTKEIASTSADLYRQGLNDSEVEQRMKSVIQYAKISSITLDESMKIITATANATGESVEKISDIFSLLGDLTA